MRPIQQAVQEKYGAIASRRDEGVRHKRACCGPSACAGSDPITSNLYFRARNGRSAGECRGGVARVRQSDGLDRARAGPDGSGSRFRRRHRRVAVGEARRTTGKVYGLDMTDEMLALARENQRKAGATNVEFLKGAIETIPLPDDSVDVIISNCVINLSADKDAVLREAFRVLKPGGRFAVSDVVVRGDVPADIRRSVELWVGCIAGALEEQGVPARLRAAGFSDVEVETVARLQGRGRACVSHRAGN